MLIIFDLDDTLVETTGSIIPSKLRHATMESPHLLNPLLRMDKMSQSSGHALDEFSEIHDIDVEPIRSHLKAEEIDDIDTLEDVEQCLKLLGREHYLCLVTRGTEKMQKLKLKEAGIDEGLFREIHCCTSSKLDAYIEVFEKFGNTPQEVLVVGDRIAKDLSPAKRLGFHTVQIVNGRGKTSRDYFSDVDVKIIHLVDLFDIIDSIERKNYLRRL